MTHIHINPNIIDHFLHVMYCNYIKLFMDHFHFDKRNDIIDFISKTQETQFWNNYELFTFDKMYDLNNIFSNQDINTEINNDFMMVDIYEKDYKHREYLVNYALHAYCQNKEKFRKELLTYIESCVGLK